MSRTIELDPPQSRAGSLFMPTSPSLKKAVRPDESMICRPETRQSFRVRKKSLSIDLILFNKSWKVKWWFDFYIFSFFGVIVIV